MSDKEQSQETDKILTKYDSRPIYKSLEEKIYQLSFKHRNSSYSVYLKEICNKLADLSYSSDSSNKYFVIEPLLLAIRNDLFERLWELSGVDSEPELPPSTKAKYEQETEYVKELHKSLEKAITYLYQLRQMGAELS